MKSIAYILLLGLISCTSIKSELFFNDYDQIIHFNNPIYNINEIDENLFSEIYFRDAPASLEDISLEDLEKLGYQKKEIQSYQFSKINDVFRKRKVKKNNLEYNCMPEYRDILIFKKNNKIAGLVKICFECEKSRFVEAKVNTISFNTNSNFKRLYKILYEKEYERN